MPRRGYYIGNSIDRRRTKDRFFLFLYSSSYAPAHVPYIYKALNALKMR